MPTEKVNIEYNLQDNASSKFASMLGKIAGVTVAIGALVQGIRYSVDAYAEQEEAISKLNTALQNNGDYTKENSDALISQANAYQKLTTFEDDAIVSAQAQLAMMGMTTSQIQQTTMSVLDFASAQGIDAAQAAEVVGKSVMSTTNALGRYGVQIDGVAGSQERLNSALGGLQGRFGGQAQAEALTFAGSIKQMQNAMSDVGETVGMVLAPHLQRLAMWITNLIERFNAFSQTKEFANIIVGFNKVVEVFVGTLKTAFEWAGKLFDLFTTSIDEKVSQIDDKIAKLEEKKAQLEEEDGTVLEKNQEKHDALMEQMAEMEDQKNALLAEKRQQDEAAQVVMDEQKAVRVATQNQKLLEMERKKQEAQKALDAEMAKNFDSTLGYIAKGMQSKNQDIFNMGKAAATAQATMDAYAAFNKSLASAPFPLNLILAGATLLVGLDQVSRIQSTQLQLAEGGIVMPQPGGVQATIAEAGAPEAVIPLDSGRAGNMLGGGGTQVSVYIEGKELAKQFYEFNTEQIRTGEIQAR